MVFAVVQKQISADGTGATSGTISVTVTAITAGSSILGAAEYANSAQPTIGSVVCGSDTLTVQDHGYDSGNQNGFLSFAKVNCTGGGTTLTVTFSGSTPSFRRIMMVEVSTGGTTSIDKHALTAVNVAGNAADINSATITPTQTGDFLYAMAANTNGNISTTFTLVAASGYTLQNNAVGPNCAMVDETQTYASTTAKTGSIHVVAATANCNYLIGVIALSPPAAGDTLFGQVWL